MSCYWHPYTPAVAVCTDCAKPLCEVCRVLVNARPYCEACAAKHHQQSPLSAFVFGLLVPGLGQVYNGDYGKGILIFLTGWLIIPWIIGIVDAVVVAQAIAEGRRPLTGVPPGYIILGLKVGVVGLSCLYGVLAWSVVSAFGVWLQR